MKKFVLAAFAAGLIYSTIPAFADDAAASGSAAATVTAQTPAVAATGTTDATAAVQTPQGGIGVDVSSAGKTSEERRAFQAKLSAAQQTTVKANCKLTDKNRTPAEQAYCADIH